MEKKLPESLHLSPRQQYAAFTVELTQKFGDQESQTPDQQHDTARLFAREFITDESLSSDNLFHQLSEVTDPENTITSMPLDTKERSFDDIIADINRAKQPELVVQKFITKSGNVSKTNKKKELPVDVTRVADLYEELASKLVLKDWTDDQRLFALDSINKHKGLNLSDQEMDKFFDYIAKMQKRQLAAVKTPDDLLKPSENTINQPDASLPPPTPKPAGFPAPTGAPVQMPASIPRVNKTATDAQLVSQEKFNQLKVSLNNKRAELAEMSVLLRGRNSKKFNADLNAKYQKALTEYQSLYELTSMQAVVLLANEGGDNLENRIVNLAQTGLVEEHRNFTKAEFDAFHRLNPKMGKVASFWAKQKTSRKVMYSFGSSAAIVAALPAVLALGAAFGVGGVLSAGTGALTARAARMIGMYKLNKKAGTVREFDKNYRSDSQLLEYRFAHEKESFDIANVGKMTAKGMSDAINTRVETDQSKNRKRLAMVVGATVVGAVAGSLLHNFLDGRTSGHGSQPDGSGSGTTQSTSGNSQSSGSNTTYETSTSSTTPDTSTTTTTVSPTNTTVPENNGGGTTPPSVKPPEGGNSGNGGVDPTNPGGPVAPTEVLPQTNVLNVPSGEGFENSIQQQFGLSDAQSHEAFMAMKPHLSGQANTYMQGGDIRISAPGPMQLNPQAAAALQDYLKSLSELDELPETE